MAVTDSKGTIAQLAVAFVAGLALGSLATRVSLPGANWANCRNLGIEAAARCSQSEHPGT